MTNLVISRLPGQRIRLSFAGQEVWLTVVEVERLRVRLAVTTGRDVTVTREELIPEAERNPERLRQ